jgi:AraC-like DNA-binding protein
MHEPSLPLAAPGAPQRPREHLYYPGATGYIFAADSLSVNQAMPFYGMILIATGEQPVRVRTDGCIVEHHAIALWAKDVHFEMPSTAFVSIAVNPLHPLFRAFTRLPAPYALPLDSARYAQFAQLMSHATTGNLAHRDALTLHSSVLDASRDALPTAPSLDRRARRLMNLLWEHPRCTLGEMAEHFGLSYHHTSHFFADTVGLSLRTYQLWQKLYRAGAPLLAGASLTDTAHAAGFVDSAHYSRAFQTAFGRCPTQMFKTRRTVVFFDDAFRNVPQFDA